MSRAEMTGILAREYGIRDEEELDAAIAVMEGVDLVIFIVPYGAKARKLNEKGGDSAVVEVKKYGSNDK